MNKRQAINENDQSTITFMYNICNLLPKYFYLKNFELRNILYLYLILKAASDHMIWFFNVFKKFKSKKGST